MVKSKIEETPDLPIICENLANFYKTEQGKEKAYEVANILASLHMSNAVIRVGFIGPLRHLKEGITESLLYNLSDEEKSLLKDLNDITTVDELLHSEGQNVENLRQMLLAMVDDIRAVVIKLALQLVAIRHLNEFSLEKRKLIALQTQEIQAPLANRLGIAKLKWELEDLALKELKPKVYHLIATSLSDQRRIREQYLNNVIEELSISFSKEGFGDVNISGRAKNINSIYNKMTKKRKRLDEIYDLLAIRIHMSSLRDCYTALGIIHSKWKHIRSEFDDYIANPKPNGYQSLHTAVTGPDNRIIEIQIRTTEMHEYAEFGVAAHWRYKEDNKGAMSTFDRQIDWLKNLLSSDDDSIREEFTSEIKEDRVYAISPKGKVIDLPAKATPLDFAYYIHTDLGHKTKGAKVNGKLVPLSYCIQTGDTIDVITAKQANPSRDWLISSFGYLASAKAKAKVKQFFKQLEKESAIEQGKSLLYKGLAKQEIVLKEKYLQSAIEKFNFKDVDKLFAAIGFGDVGLTTVTNYIEDINEDKQVDLSDLSKRLSQLPIKKSSKKSKENSSVVIEGIDDLLVSIAACCSPVPPEKIGGLITTTKGVSIHQLECLNYKHLTTEQPGRIMEVDWANNNSEFITHVFLLAKDRAELLRDISQTLLNDGASIRSADISRDVDENLSLQLQIFVSNYSQMNEVIGQLKGIKSVYSVERLTT